MTKNIEVFTQNSIRIRADLGNIYVDPFHTAGLSGRRKTLMFLPQMLKPRPMSRSKCNIDNRLQMAP